MIYELSCLTCVHCKIHKELTETGKPYTCHVFPGGIPLYEDPDKYRSYPCTDKGDSQYQKGTPAIVEGVNA